MTIWLYGFCAGAGGFGALCMRTAEQPAAVLLCVSVAAIGVLVPVLFGIDRAMMAGVS